MRETGLLAEVTKWQRKGWKLLKGSREGNDHS